MKKTIWNLIKLILFTVSALGILYGASLVLERKQSHAKYHDFFENADAVDILFLGNSHVINGLNPLTLYEETGYTAYNMGGHGQILTATYYTLMNALDYCSPRVLVVDTHMLNHDYEHVDEPDEEHLKTRNTAIEQLHLNLDAFPLTETKREAVCSLLADASLQRQFLYPVTVYHNRWGELEWNDFARLAERDTHNTTMGFEIRHEMAREMKEVLYDKGEDYTLRESVCTERLRDILELCAERNMGAVITFLPFIANADDLIDAETAAEIADEYGVPFLNFMDPATQEDAGIDLYTDLCDPGHMNGTGAEKATSYLASVLKTEYGDILTDRREDGTGTAWDKRLADFQEAEQTLPDRISDPLYLVNLIGYRKMPVVIYLPEKSKLLADPDFRHIVLGISPYLRIEEAARTGQAYLLIFDGKTLPVEAVGEDRFEEKVTFFGKATLVSSGPFHFLETTARPGENLLDMNEYMFADLQLLQFSPERSIRIFITEPGKSTEYRFP